MSGQAKPGPPPKGGKRHTVRFDTDVYGNVDALWRDLGFSDFGSYVNFTVALAHGKWEAYEFKSADEAADYLLSLARGTRVPPPHLRRQEDTHQETLPFARTAAA